MQEFLHNTHSVQNHSCCSHRPLSISQCLFLSNLFSFFFQKRKSSSSTQLMVSVKQAPSCWQSATNWQPLKAATQQWVKHGCHGAGLSFCCCWCFITFVKLIEIWLIYCCRTETADLKSSDFHQFFLSWRHSRSTLIMFYVILANKNTESFCVIYRNRQRVPTPQLRMRTLEVRLSVCWSFSGSRDSKHCTFPPVSDTP